MLKLVMRFALLALPISTAVATDDQFGAASQWAPRQPLALPVLASDVSPDAAGCVVVGHHVLADGSSADARVLKGAFAGVGSAQQQAFARSVLEAAANWRFQAVDPEQAPSAAFRLQTIGFIQVRGDAIRVVAGIEALPAQLQDVCQIKDLVAWGEANAVPVEQARAEHGGQIVVPDPATGGLYWVYKKPVDRPVFPPAAIRAGVDACVVVGLTVDESGAVTKSLMLKSDMDGELGPRRHIRKLVENSALVATAKASFAPGPDNLRRRAAIMQVPIGYQTRLRGRPPKSNCEKLTAQELEKVMRVAQ